MYIFQKKIFLISASWLKFSNFIHIRIIHLLGGDQCRLIVCSPVAMISLILTFLCKHFQIFPYSGFNMSNLFTNYIYEMVENYKSWDEIGPKNWSFKLILHFLCNEGLFS